MKRKNVKKTVKHTERGVTENGQAVVFIYEKTDGEKVQSCQFSAFENEESEVSLLTGEVRLEVNSLNVYFNEQPQTGALSLVAEILQEVETICELQKSEVENAEIVEESNAKNKGK